MKKPLSAVLVVASMLVSGSAMAEDAGGSVALGAGAAAAGGGFGRQGQIIVSVDRLFGFSMVKTHTEYDQTVGNTKVTFKGDDSGTIISLFGTNHGADTLSSPWLTPHAGVHYAVIPNLTIGLGLGITKTSGTTKSSTESNGTTKSVERDLPDTTGIFLAPRVGYVIPLSPPKIDFWLRGGLSYFSYKSTASREDQQGNQTVTRTDTTSVSGLALSLDPMVVISPVQGFGFMFGPVIDIPLSGSGTVETKVEAGGTTTTTSQDLKIKYTHYGVMAGMVGYF